MSGMKKSFARLKENQFLFEELVKRDFKIKYKRTILGVGWSLLSPLLTLLVMKLVFTHFLAAIRLIIRSISSAATSSGPISVKRQKEACMP